MSRIYVYALVDRAFPPIRRRGRTIEVVEIDGAGGVFAAVERTDHLPAVSEAVLEVQHDLVTCIAGVADAILPARFGSLVDEVELEQLVALRGPSIREALTLVRGRAQMTVRVSGRGDDEDDGDRGTRGSVAAPVERGAALTGTEYLEQRRAASLGRALPEDTAAIAAAVGHLLVARRSVPGRGRLLVTLYHLIERGTEEAYADALAPVRSRFGESRLTVSGPWPPFAFAPDLWP